MPTCWALPAKRTAADGSLHRRRRPDVVPARPDGLSNRKYHYYWLPQNFSALRCGEYKMVLTATSDDDPGNAGPGGFTGVLQRFAYARLYNLYLDPKEDAQLHDAQARLRGSVPARHPKHLGTFRRFPPKKVMGLQAADPRAK